MYKQATSWIYLTISNFKITKDKVYNSNKILIANKFATCPMFYIYIFYYYLLFVQHVHVRLFNRILKKKIQIEYRFSKNVFVLARRCKYLIKYHCLFDDAENKHEL